MSAVRNRCIWITGASSGLGRELAIQLAKAGNFVIASARSQNALSELAGLYPGRIKPLRLDVSSQLDKQAASAELLEVTDYLDMVICAAGICEYEDNLSFDPAIYQRQLDVNFLGVVRVFNLALPLLKRAQNRPHFVAISSLSTCVGMPRAEAYGSSKAALNYFIQSLRADFAQLPIDFTLVRPGFVATPLTVNNDFPMPFIQTAEEASAHIIKRLAKRPFAIDFPRRLSWPLRLANLFFKGWCRWVAPRMTRLHDW
jgi:NAD(P)-dependent dehydrogenase (short-subunit alcohol dehydrogenase family)